MSVHSAVELPEAQFCLSSGGKSLNECEVLREDRREPAASLASGHANVPKPCYSYF